MSYHRPRTKTAIRHTDQTTIEHRCDKALGEKRRAKCHIVLDADESQSSERDLSGLAPWALRRDDTGRFVPCTQPGEYGDYAEAEAKARSSFIDTVQRTGGTGKMRRKVRSPLEYLVISGAPWLSARIHDMLEAGQDPSLQLRRVFGRWLPTVGKILAEDRHWLGVSCHTDTSDLHVDLLCSRYSRNGQRIGRPGLKLAGPWMVGVDRQIRAGAVIAPYKQRQLRANHERHASRYGEESVPTDLKLARALDEAAEIEMPELARYRAEYGRSVPALERAHMERAAKQAKAVAERLSKLARESQAQAAPELSIDR